MVDTDFGPRSGSTGAVEWERSSAISCKTAASITWSGFAWHQAANVVSLPRSPITDRRRNMIGDPHAHLRLSSMRCSRSGTPSPRCGQQPTWVRAPASRKAPVEDRAATGPTTAAVQLTTNPSGPSSRMILTDRSRETSDDAVGRPRGGRRGDGLRGASRQDARESGSVPHVGMPAKRGVNPALVRMPLRTSGRAVGTVAR